MDKFDLSNPDNLAGVDYAHPPARRVPGLPIIDCHVHLRGELDPIRLLLHAAGRYGVGRVLSMSPLEHVAAIQQAFGEHVGFIAVPDYRSLARTAAFQRQWCGEIEQFARVGARLCKFWSAPRAKAQFGLTLDDPWMEPMIAAALDAGLAFMVHVADPDTWYATRYADASVYGTKAQAHEQLERFCERVSPRAVIAAHFAGHPEDLDHLAALIARHANLMLDTSATRWVLREVSRHDPACVQQFFREHAARIVFGSDLVVGPDRDFDHYASRYWAQQMLWETDFSGLSPIADPDLGNQPAVLQGVSLPDDVLRAIYYRNIQRLLGGSD